ncbi:MAG TPA: efflux RND transporter periplasmic adaptor subunit [Bryobacteraceae bacterium]|nr:efflux RND transporter periplasmic adaptor subunit [Bryobacteraceae bacterium]
MKKLLVVLLAGLLVLAGWLLHRERNRPPEAVFARAARETLVSSLVTNGKVEPLEWSAVLAERAGVVETFRAERGRQVSRGDVLLELGAAEARTELAAAEARVAEARAVLQLFERGGRAADLAGLEGDTARARMELEAARKDHASLQRLAARQAATSQEVEEAARRIQTLELRLQDLAKRGSALADPSDKAAAEARLREAETAVELARRRLEKAVVRSPASGVIYETQARPGSFLNLGDAVAKVGRIGSVRVRLYVDEPELGRVAPGMPVAITWDGMQGRRWQGTVERMPTEITALGTRQVGEVMSVIDNPGGELLPGANVNAEIRSRVADSALSIPREALRRRGEDAGVLVLQGDRVAWRKVRTGISSVTRTEVLEGLAEGDAVALPTETALTDSARVRPVFR